MPYSPGQSSPISLIRVFASSKVANASTKCRLPSPCNLKTQKGRRIQTPNGGRPKEGQWSDYHTKIRKVNVIGHIRSVLIERALVEHVVWAACRRKNS